MLAAHFHAYCEWISLCHSQKNIRSYLKKIYNQNRSLNAMINRLRRLYG